jgi:hypothetical protein
LINWTTGGFSRRAQLHGVSYDRQAWRSKLVYEPENVGGNFQRRARNIVNATPSSQSSVVTRVAGQEQIRKQQPEIINDEIVPKYAEIFQKLFDAGSKTSCSDGIRKREEYWSRRIERHREKNVRYLYALITV